MSRRFRAFVLLRGAAAAFTAVLLSVPALAALRPVETAACCRPAGASTGCCVGGDVPANFSANCCHLSAPEEAAPSLQSSAPAHAATFAILLDQPLPSVAAPFAGPARRVAPRARSAPLFLLFAVFLI